jgi:hypothetical protein
MEVASIIKLRSCHIYHVINVSLGHSMLLLDDCVKPLTLVLKSDIWELWESKGTYRCHQELVKIFYVSFNVASHINDVYTVTEYVQHIN